MIYLGSLVWLAKRDCIPLQVLSYFALFSSTLKSGIIIVACFFSEYITKDEALDDIDKNWESIAPHLLDYYYTIPKEKHNSTAKLIRKHYFGDDPIGKKNIRTLTHLVGDRMFIVDAEKAARAQAEVNQSPVFFYYYSYRASTSISENETGSTEDFG